MDRVRSDSGTRVVVGGASPLAGNWKRSRFFRRLGSVWDVHEFSCRTRGMGLTSPNH